MGAVELEIFHHLFSAVAEEMGVALGRTAFSPNIKERLDFSCAVFDRDGAAVAQAAHIPVHLGSMPLSVAAAIRDCSMAPGDVVLLNDPFRGGTHLPDLTVVAPVYLEGASSGPTFYVADRAHHADVGGAAAGSMSLAREIYQEGLVIPPVRIARAGTVERDLMALLLANVRTPREREGDLRAQLAALETGRRRLERIWARYGRGATMDAARALQDYAERMVVRALREIPDGLYEFEDFLDDDGFGYGPIRLAVSIRIAGGRAVVDFDGTDGEVEGPMNATRGITTSAVLYVFRCLADPSTPTNAGILRPIEVRIPEGSVLAARPPAAVAAGNVETSQRVVDVLFGALAKARPDLIPAASGGSMNNVVLGGWDPIRKKPFTYYETIACGMGARESADGLSGVHTHMTNTRNTAVESLERIFPFRVTRYGYRRGSGGGGFRRGGDGLVREYEALVPMELSILSERRTTHPWGSRGGEPGRAGRNVLRTRSCDVELPGKTRVMLGQGDAFAIETPGGGGYGQARLAPVEEGQ
ncbi:MAG: hydantoinase B/oxoprolinase family protein [Planctomycetes bacterium]|nr:hydantoinase B/oxoprolinase family protein [Planctomycetota bacterium]